ncbi:LysR substrate-binding domain-containing protein [Pseudomonas kermanshahensis]|jgi:Transcriptional regulator|uniref:LysR substrate-binding domain-containing protein n=1 Tax=Pseudomonas kermanshahensis TaxID=2745482 RepID=A0ABU8QZY3_9PSED|nr:MULTISPECIES: LysR substrate-binding domain-containing protein [Pseudomonas]MBC3485625.1 LysR family transcriptional regulator [Pseudomonas sp. SWRI50]MCX2684532.1 LysR substrate-binding domain-containing protein [Pseudomonas sp. DCB_AW]USS53401.1 LysR substrate-binding domain-containing protein [Pseudomonas kermanshahensis]UVL69259.1 LysR substrate-binding domain-containing protein [Pseudomonas sp. B21-031]SMF19120.1 DNA-binding transcriptional regulator, LysR family [Pseudomonas sp. LAIL1
MDVVQLKTLIHVAELGSLSKASDRLHIAQPALSRQIRQLEKELGVYLFERHGRGMIITDAGSEVLQHATRIMDELEAIRSSVVGGHASFRGAVAIGTTPTIAEIVTVPLVTRIREAHPDLSIRFSSAFSGYLVDWIQRGELELAISYDLEPLHTLRIVPVMMENLVLVGPPSAGLAWDNPVNFATLAQQQLVLPSPRHGLRKIMDHCAADVGFKIAANVEADSFGAMIDLVRHGFGLTALPLASIYTHLQNGTLCAAPLIEPTPMRKLVMVSPADRHVSPATRYVGETFVELASELVAQGIWAGHML